MATARKPLFRNSAGLMQTFPAGDSLDMQSGKIENVLDPTNPQDAATKNYVDNLVNGVQWKDPAKAVATANTAITGDPSPVDGVTLVTNDRILLTGQTTASENGLWVVNTAGAWSRPTDFAAGSSAAGAVCVVLEGTTYADTAWLCTTNPPNDVVNTNPLAFTQYPTINAYTAGNGLDLTGFQFSVDLAAVNPGLEFQGASPNGELAVLADSTTGAIDVGASGVFLMLDNTPTTLQITASGLKVVGVPDQFLINGVPTSATVTANALNELTAGPNSPGSAYHFHSVNKLDDVSNTGGVAVSNPVYVTPGTDMDVTAADATTMADDAIIIGVCDLAAAGGNPTRVITFGPAGGFAGLTAGQDVWLAAGGGYTTTVPSTAGDRLVRLGVALDSGTIFVQVQDFGTV